MQLNKFVHDLNRAFFIEDYGPDPAFSRWIPQVYDSVQIDWHAYFHKDFCRYYNGLMIAGNEEVHKVFLAVFPTDDILERFIEESERGDLLFMHHPIVMECGDPFGGWGNGFKPIEEKYLKRIKAKGLSVYTCHNPLDYHPTLGTSLAIAKSLQLDIIDGLLENEYGFPLILICQTKETNTLQLSNRLKDIFDIPYVDVAGVNHTKISKVAVVAGCGDKVAWMKLAEEKQVDAYITGEIHCHIDNEYGRKRYKEMKDYAKTTTMSLIGVSHAASEYLVKRTLVKAWFQQTYDIEVRLLPQQKWWV